MYTEVLIAALLVLGVANLRVSHPPPHEFIATTFPL